MTFESLVEVRALLIYIGWQRIEKQGEPSNVLLFKSLTVFCSLPPIIRLVSKVAFEPEAIKAYVKEHPDHINDVAGRVIQLHLISLKFFIHWV